MPKNLTILLVDDDLDEHFFFREALDQLQMGNCHIVSVYDGIEAMEYLLRNRAPGAQSHPLPDFIVLDLNMPVLDGWEVLQQLQNNKDLNCIPVYVLTTSWQDAHRTECIRLGCSGFFSKPPENQDLITVIQSMLNDAAEKQEMIS